MSIHDHSQHEGPQGSFLTSRTGLVLIGFIVIAGALLFTEHRAHVLGALIWLVPVGCIVMHVFMHGGHGGHGSHGSHGQQDREMSST